MELKLRDYQDQNIAGHNGIRKAFAKHKSVLYVLPTGGGKTVVFTFVVKSSYLKGKRCLILVHRKELLNQTSIKLTEAGVPHGLISPKHNPNYNENIQVAMVSTLKNRLDKYKDFDFIVIDEAHHSNAATWGAIIEHYNKAKILGVTATPIRADGKALGDIFETMVIGPQIGELIQRGFLVQPEVYLIPSGIDRASLKKRKGDFVKAELEEKYNKPKIIGDAVDSYTKYATGLPAVVFCISVAHAQQTSMQFREAGYKSAVLTGDTEDRIREAMINGLANGKIDVLCSVDVISEGTDIPVIGCVIFLRPTKSVGLYIQQGGRGLRSSNGKKGCVILDHVGNTWEHMPLDIDREWSLSGEKKSKNGKPKEKTIPIKQCPSCFYVFQNTNICPKCSHEIQVKKREIKQGNGELVKLTPEMKAKMKQQKRHEIYNARTEAELKAVADKFGYKSGWVKAIMEARLNKR